MHNEQKYNINSLTFWKQCLNESKYHFNDNEYTLMILKNTWILHLKINATEWTLKGLSTR